MKGKKTIKSMFLNSPKQTQMEKKGFSEKNKALEKLDYMAKKWQKIEK